MIARKMSIMNVSSLFIILKFNAMKSKYLMELLPFIYYVVR